MKKIIKIKFPLVGRGEKLYYSLVRGLMGGDKEGDNPGCLKLTYNKRCLSNQEPKFVTSSLAKN